MHKRNIKMENKSNYIYDIEILPNFFCVTFMNAKENENEYHQFIIYNDNIYDLISLKKFYYAEVNYLIGYNNKHYDDPILNFILSLKQKSNEINKLIYTFSQNIINKNVKELYKYKLKSVDLMKLLRLDILKISLKQIAINLNHDWIQDFPLSHTHIISSQGEIDLLLEYNKNDVLITKKLYRNSISELLIREGVNQKYKVDTFNDNRTNVAKRILRKELFENTSTDYLLNQSKLNNCDFYGEDIIDKKISFNDNKLVNLLNEIKNHNFKNKFNKKLIYENNLYSLGQGGIHTEDNPLILKCNINDNFEILDVDVTSFYPQIIINLEVYPRHLGKYFVNKLECLTLDRIEAKKTNKLKAESLKITINSIYGLLGSEHSELYDPMAMYKVTINGQLYILKLIEMIQGHCEILSSNTDGITIKVLKSKKEKILNICKDWETEFGFILEYSKYKLIVRRDVNNYLVQKENEELKTKGCFEVEKNLEKASNFKIIPILLHDYFIKGLNPTENIKNYKNIYDYSASQRVGGDFSLVFSEINKSNNLKNEIKLQKVNRYCVCKKEFGGILKKEDIKKNKKRSISILSNQQILLLNDLRLEQKKKFIDCVDFTYYLKETYKLINIIEGKNKNLTLF